MVSVCAEFNPSLACGSRKTYIKKCHLRMLKMYGLKRLLYLLVSFQIFYRIYFTFKLPNPSTCQEHWICDATLKIIWNTFKWDSSFVALFYPIHFKTQTPVGVIQVNLVFLFLNFRRKIVMHLKGYAPFANNFQANRWSQLLSKESSCPSDSECSTTTEQQLTHIRPRDSKHAPSANTEFACAQMRLKQIWHVREGKYRQVRTNRTEKERKE